MDYGDADTPLARWLRSKIGATKLKEIERRSRARGVPILASLLSNYLHGLSAPKPPTQRRLAAFFEVPVSDVRALVPAAAPAPGPVSVPSAEVVREIARELIPAAVRETVEQLGLTADLTDPDLRTMLLEANQLPPEMSHELKRWLREKLDAVQQTDG